SLFGAVCAGAVSAMLIATIRACVLVDVMSALLFCEIDLLTGRSKPEAGKRHALCRRRDQEGVIAFCRRIEIGFRRRAARDTARPGRACPRRRRARSVGRSFF